MMGLGFVFRPRMMMWLNKAYLARVKRLEKRLFKAHRATGLLMINVGLVILLTYFYPVWIYNCFLITRVVAGVFFPSLFEPARSVVIPTYWI